MRHWDALPAEIRTAEVAPYYNYLKDKEISIFIKRIFDVCLSAVLLILLAIPMLIIGILISHDSKGGVFFRQERVTQYGRHFKMHKFRTMTIGADKIGPGITSNNDSRVTKIGQKLRHYRLDELPQVIDVLQGNMSFVGTRPEIPKYVEQYTDEMYATLLMPAGITSEASIKYKDEAKLIQNAEDTDRVYMEEVLPAKMKYNLYSIQTFSLINDLKVMFKTVLAVFLD